MRNMAHMEVKGRIADALLEMSDVFGTDAEGYIAMAVTRHDIASYAGTTYETVFKFLTELSAAGTLATEGKKIKINAVDSLKQLITNPT
jgi:CRP/FNR family transcriptional regulator